MAAEVDPGRLEVLEVVVDDRHVLGVGGVGRDRDPADLEEVVPAIEDRVRRGVLPLADSSDLRLVATTLQGLGGNPAMIREHAKSDPNQKDFANTVEKTLLEVNKRKRCF